MLDQSTENQSEAAADTATALVGLDITLIADGLLDGGESALVSLVVLPRSLDPSENRNTGIELVNWPQRIHELFADPGDYDVKADGNPLTSERIGLHEKMPGAQVLNEAWAEALRLDDPDELEAIAEMLADADASLREAEIKQPKAILSYDACCLARQMGRLHGTLSALQAARLIALDEGKVTPEAAPFLNKYSPLSLQSTSVSALLSRGEPEINLADPPDRTDDRFSLDKDIIKRRIAWTGRKRAGAAEMMGYVNPLVGRSGDQARHNDKNVSMNGLLAKASDQLVGEAIGRQEILRRVFLAGDPEAGLTEEVQSVLDELTVEPETSEREEALQRVLNGLSDSLTPDGVFTTRSSQDVHGIDLARAAYDIAMMEDLEGYERALDATANSKEADAVDLEKLNAQQRFDRRVSGLLAYPEVARLFGLIVDLKVSVDDIKQVTSRDEIVMLAGPPTTMVAASRRPSHVSLVGGFQPVSFRKDRPEDQLYKAGFVQMGPSHRLMTLDVNQAYESSKHAAGSDQTAMEHGEPIDRVSSGMTSPRTAGLVLVDTARDTWAELDQELANLDKKNPMRALYLEDLIIGYRIDIGRAENGKIVWTEGSQRRVQFPKLKKILGLDLGIAQPELRHRDRTAGVIQSPHRLIEVDSDANGEELAVPFQTICTWRNWTLGAPSISQTIQLTKSDLQLDVKVGVDAHGPKMMSQRIGRSYVMGARAVAMNGSSLSFEEAKAGYSSYSDVIAHEGAEHEETVRAQGTTRRMNLDALAERVGRRPGTEAGYPVYRQDPIAAPKLFLDAKNAPKRENSEVAGTHELQLNEIVAAIEHADRLKWNNVSRYLLVDGAPFDLCLMDGALDRFDNLPPNSYKSFKVWPEAEINKTGPIENPLIPGDESARENLGDTFALDRSKLTERYWVDPKAEVMFIAFFKNGELAPEEFYPAPLAINLYPDGPNWPYAHAVEVTVKPVASAGPVPGSRLRAGFDVGKSPGIVRVAIEVEPAEILQVYAWCVPRELADFAKMSGYETLVRIARELDKTWSQGFRSKFSESGDPLSEIAGQVSALANSGSLYQSGFEAKSAKSTGLFHDVQLHDGNSMVAFRPSCLAPIHGLNQSLCFEATHAVAKPLIAPEIRDFAMVHELTSADVASGENQDDPYITAWRKALLESSLPNTAANKAHPDQRRTSQRIMLRGKVEFDRRSTSDIKLNARWLDYNPSMPVSRNQKTQVCEPAPAERTYAMAELSELAYEVGNEPQNELSLTHTEGGLPRLLTLDLESTRAVRLRVSATAVSRFSRAYEDEIPANEFTETGEETEYWLPSTRRPDEPRPEGIESSIHFSGEGTSATPMQGMTVMTSARRAVRLRVDLGTSWYSSGEGEKFGIVCFPKLPLGDGGEAANIGATIKNFGSYTAWGRDPVFETGEIGRFVTTEQFLNASSVTQARLPVTRDQDNGQIVTGHANCNLALFDVACDPDTGRYYVDIEVDPEESYNAFIQLQMVRHQSCAIEGLETSFSRAQMASLLPSRDVKILESESGFEITYSGVCYKHMSEPCHLAAAPLIHTPQLDVHILRRANGASDLSSGLPVETAGAGTIQEAWMEKLLPDMSGDIGTWTFEITENAQTDPSEESVQIAPGNLANGIIVFLREVETYLTDPEESEEDDPTNPVRLATVNRSTASFSFSLSTSGIMVGGD